VAPQFRYGVAAWPRGKGFNRRSVVAPAMTLKGVRLEDGCQPAGVSHPLAGVERPNY
jgi:hypothetical protein